MTMDTEILTDVELGKRVKKSTRWIQHRSREWLVKDAIPSIRLGKTYRYLWGSPELESWLARQATTPTKTGGPLKNRKAQA